MDKTNDTIVGTISKVVPLKSGKSIKNGKEFPYTIYEVIINGEQFRTFDSGYQKHLGEEREWNFTREQRTSARGTIYESKTLIPLQGKGQGSQDNGAVVTELKEIKAMVLDVLKAVKSIGKEEEDPFEELVDDTDGDFTEEV